MYISYSGFKCYLTCPRQYWHQYVGQTKLNTQDNRVSMLYGSVVGSLFEAFYNDQLWRSKDVVASLTALVDPMIKRIMAEEVRRGGVFNWLDPRTINQYVSLDALREDVIKAIPNGLAIIKTHRFLGPFAEAEMKLDSQLNGHTLGGRADFVIERTKPHGDLIILDGKGSKHRGKYVDGMQLRWYAMLHRLRHQRIPDKLGFVFWRWGPNKAVDWVDFTPEGLTDLSKEVLATIARIEEGKASLRGSAPCGGGPFAAIAKDHNCKLCSYVTACPEGTSVTDSPLKLAPGGVAVEDVSLDP